MVVVAGFALLARLAGAAKEVAVAWRFGVGAEVDAYLLVFNLVNWPVGIIAGVLPVVLLPLLGRAQREGSEGMPRFLAETLGLTVAVGVIFSLGMLIVLPQVVSAEWFGLPATTAALALQIIPSMSWYPLAGLVVALYSSWIMSENGHANTLIEGVPALFVMLAVVFWGGIAALAWGTIVGAGVQVLSSLVAQTGPGRAVAPRFSLSSPSWLPLWNGLGIMLLGQTVLGFSVIVDQFFAARLDEGAISALGYSGRILSLLTVLVATAVGRATLPVFSASTHMEVGQLRALARRWSLLTGLAGVAVALVGWATAPLMVRLLFERGTFDGADTIAVSRVLRFAIVQLPVFCASLVLVSLHSSQGRYRLLLAGGVLGLAVKLVASVALLPLLGVSGLMLSYTAMYAANLLLFLWAAQR